MADRFSVVPSSYVLLRRGDQVLLQLRQGTGYMDGHWVAGAAGHLEQGETAAQAAVREAREELGIAIDPADLRPLTVMQRTDGTTNPREQRVDWFFAADRWAGEPQVQEAAKCAAVQWFSLRELPTPIPAYERLVLDGMAGDDLPTLTAMGFPD